jgi:hypothetical protein
VKLTIEAEVKDAGRNAGGSGLDEQKQPHILRKILLEKIVVRFLERILGARVTAIVADNPQIPLTTLAGAANGVLETLRRAIHEGTAAIAAMLAEDWSEVQHGNGPLIRDLNRAEENSARCAGRGCGEAADVGLKSLHRIVVDPYEVRNPNVVADI